MQNKVWIYLSILAVKLFDWLPGFLPNKTTNQYIGCNKCIQFNYEYFLTFFVCLVVWGLCLIPGFAMAHFIFKIIYHSTLGIIWNKLSIILLIPNVLTGSLLLIFCPFFLNPPLFRHIHSPEILSAAIFLGLLYLPPLAFCILIFHYPIEQRLRLKRAWKCGLLKVKPRKNLNKGMIFFLIFHQGFSSGFSKTFVN